MRFEKLREYELTGLEPEEVKAKCAWADNTCKLLDGVFGGSGVFDFTHIKELLTAEAEGRLLILPCKVGDFLYEVDLPEYGVIVCEVLESLYINKHKAGRKDAPVVTCGTVTVEVIDGHGAGSCYDFEPQDFGKTVFLTREEAEKELRAKR